MLADVKEQFPILKKKMMGKPLVYFDSAATTLKPKKVVDVMHDFYLHEYATVHRGIYELSIQATDKFQKARRNIQNFIHAEEEDEIVFTKNTTESINLVAQTFGEKYVQPGDEIIISEIEHHSNIVPWQMMCAKKGAKLRVVPVNDKGELLFDEYLKLLNEKTKMVAMAWVSNALGTVHDVERIIQKAHEYDAYVLIDAAQASAHLKMDVQKIDADFLVFSSHKTYGPTGVGVLYGKRDLLESLPPYQGGGGMISEVTVEGFSTEQIPLKFEAGTPPIAEIIGLGEAIEYIQELGLDNIYAWEDKLLKNATPKIQKIDRVKIIGEAENKGPIVSFVVEGLHSLDVGSWLNLQGIAIRTGHHCAQPTMSRFGQDATARVSFGIYNTEEEIDQFVVALQSAISKFG